MAFTSGTIAGGTAAAGHYALLDIIHTFCTTGLGAYNWTDIKYETMIGSSPDAPYNRKEWMFIAPGLSGTEAIYGGVRTRTSGAYANFELAGYFGNYGADPSWDTDFDSGPIRKSHYFTLWDEDIDYWIAANGQRLIVVARCGIRWTMCYLGKFLPYATPSEYPYPFFIGGSNPSSTSDIASTAAHRTFATPVQGSCSAFLPINMWIDVYNVNSSGTYTTGVGSLFPTRSGQLGASNWVYFYSTANPDGSVNLVPFEIQSTQPPSGNVGQLDGVYWVSGRNKDNGVYPPGTIVSVSGEDYILVPSIYRLGWSDWAAVRLT